jgi:hypothetical protein
MTKTSHITKLSELDTTELTFSDLNKMSSGAQFGNIQKNGRMCLLQLPKITGFGADKFEDQEKGDHKFTMSVQFTKEDIETNPTIKSAFEKLQEIRTCVKTNSKENSQDYFKKKKASDDYVDASFSDFLKESKNKNTEEPDGRYYTLKLKLKLSKKEEGKFDFGAFDSNKQKMDLTLDNITDKVRKWSKVKCTITPNIWIIGGKFGVTWNLHQMQYWEPEGGIPDKNEFCMIDSSDDEEEEDVKEDPHELIEDDDDSD